MIKIFYEDKKSFADKYGQELSDLFFQNKNRLPKEVQDISVWEHEYKKNPKIARRRLKSYLDEFSSSSEIDQFQNKFGSALYTRFSSVRNFLPSRQKSYKYWLDSSKEELWDIIDEYLPNSYWQKVQQGAELIKEDKEWEVYKITNYEASEYYGRGTGWCTSGNYPGFENEGLKFFNKYAKTYYFYFNKNTGALYNRFRKNPDQPGPDIQIWQGITDNGKTIDKENYGVDLPKIKDLDGEEKQVSLNNNSKSNINRNNIIELIQSETIYNSCGGAPLSVYKAQQSNYLYIKCYREMFFVYEINAESFFQEIVDDVGGGGRRFAEEYFTDDEILQINDMLTSPIPGINEDIIKSFREDRGLEIWDKLIDDNLIDAIYRLFMEQGYFDRNIGRILEWKEREHPGNSLVKATVNNSVIYLESSLDPYDYCCDSDEFDIIE